MNACYQPDIQAAIRDGLKTAKAVCYRQINDVADAMGVNWEVLYKWAQTGRMPVVHVPDFEQVCADAAVTRALAAAQGYLLVPVIVDTQTPQLDMARVHCQVASAMLAAATAQVEPAQAGEAVRAITQAINSLATLRHRYAQATP